jgi:endonuclease/exonuclease/phosphatase family metal-dependent hydrolase
MGFALATVPATASAHTLRPSAPTGLHVVKVTGTSISIAANPAAHANRYRLYASTVRSDLYVANISHAQRSPLSGSPRLTVSGLSRVVAPYYYRVQALNGTRSKFSNTIGQVGLRLAPPTNLHVASTPVKTYVSWAPTAATGYRVEQATNRSMTSHRKEYKVLGQAHQFTPYGLKKGQTYYFRVRSLNQSTPSTASATTQAVARSSQQHVRVMTYNIKEAKFDGQAEGGTRVAPWSTKRKPAAVRLIRRAQPDVIGIQEGACAVSRHSRARQVDTLRKALGGSYKLARTEIPPGQPGTQRTGDNILYRASTFKAAGRGGHWMIGDNHFAAHQFLRNRQTGGVFLFVSAHLWVPKGRAGDVKRQHETETMVAKAKALAGRRGVPVVYVGDFNSDQFNHAFNGPARVMARAGINDAYSVAQKKVLASYNTANHYMRRPPHKGARIDYIFAPAGVAVHSWKLIMRLHHGSFVGTIPSDHNPVVSDLSIPNS